MKTLKPCPVCGKQPKLSTYWWRQEYGPHLYLYGAQYCCASWLQSVFGTAHRVTEIMWNDKSWADLAIQRAQEAWDQS